MLRHGCAPDVCPLTKRDDGNPTEFAGHSKDLGGGFNVRRLLPAARQRSVGRMWAALATHLQNRELAAHGV